MSARAVFTWLDDRTETVEILATRDGRVYVAWPESRRTVEGSSLYPPLPPGLVQVVRPESWVDEGRLRYACGSSPDPERACDELAIPGTDACGRHGAS